MSKEFWMVLSASLTVTTLASFIVVHRISKILDKTIGFLDEVINIERSKETLRVFCETVPADREDDNNEFKS